mgnify:CR=1 FL=1
MKECVWAMYFSPTGGTKKAALYLAEGLGKEIKEVNLSDPDFKGAEFEKDDLVKAHRRKGRCCCYGCRLWKQGL